MGNVSVLERQVEVVGFLERVNWFSRRPEGSDSGCMCLPFMSGKYRLFEEGVRACWNSWSVGFTGRLSLPPPMHPPRKPTSHSEARPTARLIARL